MRGRAGGKKEGLAAPQAACQPLQPTARGLGQERGPVAIALKAACLSSGLVTQEPALLGRAAELAEALWLQDVPLDDRTLQALLFGLIRLGKVPARVGRVCV